MTWGIRTDSGGLTVTLLHRAGILSQAGAGHIQVLTFDNFPDYAQVEQELREMGRLFGDVSLLNIWDWLREQPLAQNSNAAKAPRTDTLIPITEGEEYVSTYRNGHEISRTRFLPDGLTALQIDHYREDGTLLASDRRDVKSKGTKGGRWITLCDTSGKPIRSWRRSAEFYHYVLDKIRDKQPTTYLVDSKTSANFMMTYRRRDALVVHIVQGSHAEGVTSDGRILLTDARSKSIAGLAQFDLVATLTQRQRKDLVHLVGNLPSMRVIPNSVPLPDSTSIVVERPVNNGLVVAAFVPRKRVHLALEAMAQAVALAPDAGLHLDVYGEGETRPEVEQSFIATKAGDFAILHGYNTQALNQTQTSSFILITSETEGTPLVLLEGMAAGCIPISFDIPYGPSDVITHGVNGFLIPDGDTAAMAAAIVKLQQLPSEKVLSMRTAAMAAVAQYSDAEIVRLWEKELTTAWKRKNSRIWKRIYRWYAERSVRIFERRNPEIAPPLPPAPRVLPPR